MYVEVIPIVRLPRRFTFFDYRLPADLNANIGDLVRVTLRRREIFGIIRKVKETTKINANDIVSVEIKNFITPFDIERFEKIAQNIYQSPSSVMLAAFGQMKLRFKDVESIQTIGGNSIDKTQANLIGSAISSTKECVFVQASLETEFALAGLLRKKIKGQMLILMPREHLIQNLIESIDLGQVQVLKGKTPAAKKEKILHSWRTGKIQTLIGIKNAALLPAKKLGIIHIIDAGAGDWSILDQNPRYDARPAVELLAKQHKAKIFLSGPVPILGWNTENYFDFEPAKNVVSLKAEDERTGHIYISSSLKNAISNTLQKQKFVLLSFNRKGAAQSLECKDCGHIPFCGTCGAQPIIRVSDMICPSCGIEMWIPKQCPACGSKNLSQRGIGNKKIQSIVQKLFPETNVGIIDKDIQQEGNIILATEYYFSQVHSAFNNKNIGLVAELCFERSLGFKYSSGMDACYKIQRLKLIARNCKAELIVQAFDTELAKQLLQLEKYLKHELGLRNKYHLPPFAPKISVTCNGSVILPQQALKD
ncbi:hypothetical protein KJ766_00960, partial [Patescibacteria group bacterium]|nr:hypothetical protein [Patescibacteria group bacterium]